MKFIYILQDMLHYDQAGLMPGGLYRGMVMHQPGVLVKAEHGDMSVDPAPLLIDDKPGNFRILSVKFPVERLELFLLVLDVDILPGIDEAGFEEEIKQRVEINICRADI
ncbi:hypothetical protein BMS3Abin13_00614 [bacterium BMS3Abin13]|nr:hypothetical protein BMS3Abin13_00614 [bacterium BMS3Abin13]